MGAEADGLAVFEYEDLVGAGDRRDPLRHDHHGRSGRERHERGTQPCVGGEVERRERVVEQVDLGLSHERPRNGQSLTLPTGNVRAPLRYSGVELTGHVGHEVLGLRDFERLPQLFVGGVGLAVAQVAGDRPGEEVRLLRHEPDPVPEHIGLEIADVHAIDEHRARRRIGQAGNQVDHRGLARTGAADDGRGLAGQREERDVFENRFLGARVVEADISKLE